MSVDRWHKCDLFPTLDNIHCVYTFVTFMTMCDVWSCHDQYDHNGVARAEPHLLQIVTRPGGNWRPVTRGEEGLVTDGQGASGGHQAGQAH